MKNSNYENDESVDRRSGIRSKPHGCDPQRPKLPVGVGHSQRVWGDDLCPVTAHYFLEQIAMSKNNRIPSTEPLFPRKPAISGAPDAASAPEVLPLPEDVPVLHSLGLVKVKRNGWVVVRTFSEGDKIVSKEVLSEPENLNFAMERMKIACVRIFFPDVISGKVSCDT